LLDIGNGGALSLPPDYWRTRADLAQLPFAESQLGGVGGMHGARAVSMPKVTLAGQTFERVPAILSDSGSSDEPAQMTNVGIGLLKQFHVDLDLGRDRIYLAPRGDAPPFEHDRAGLRLERTANALKVVFVSPQGPAAAAGLKVGDQITAVDGRKVDARYYERPDWTRLAAGTPISLERADGTTVLVKLADYY
jgi:membrane-associated protease RseP (regulator of RpoE activity)